MNRIKIFAEDEITPWQLAQFERAGCDAAFETVNGKTAIMVWW